MTRIAVVGMACRYPDATSPEELWQNALGRRRAFRRLPECRLPATYRGAPEQPDLTYVTHAAVLRDWEFDRERFGIPGQLFRAADHTHWLALETAADALIDAGFPRGAGLDRDSVGVVLGNSLAGEFTRAATLRLRWPFIADAAAAALDATGVASGQAKEVLSRLESLVKQPFPEPGDESLAGSLANTIAGRICNHFDFHGAGYTVDGACSSSLLAIMTACRDLAAGAHDFMLAGGVDMSMDPFELVGFARLGALAGTEMRVYDVAPTGFLPGEGCGIVALMRAKDADRLGLRTYAHIAGWAAASDGAGGLTRPTQGGQALALRQAYRIAGLRPGDAQLIEGHGTGTAIGDTTELAALTAMRDGSGRPAALGTIKANIGHTKAAAGVAGLIKATMAIHQRTLPPTTGCERPHALLRRPGAPLRVLSDPEPWPDGQPTAGVSSMGFGGINVHLVLTGAAASGPPATASATARRWAARTGPHEIVLVGAGSTASLADQLTALTTTAAQLSSAEVRDIAATAWRDSGGTTRFRGTLVARSPDELTAAARAAATAATGWDGALRFDPRLGYALGSAATPRIGLLFPGQAAPTRLELPWWATKLDVPEFADEPARRDTDTALAQPAIVRQSLAGLAWLRALGCEAVAAAGHSLGEITALHWAGACGTRTVLELATARGAILAEHGLADTAMVSLAASAEQAAVLIDGTTTVLAGYNAPDQVVISGTRREVDLILARARDNGVTASLLPVSHGFHSPAMRAARQPLRDLLNRLAITAATRPVYSTVTGKRLAASDDLVELLTDQLTCPVRFTDAITALAGSCALLVEVGPGTVLTELARANRVAAPAVSMDCGGDPRRHAFVTALLAACGAADLAPWFAERPYRGLSLRARPRFLPNPCEDRSSWAGATSAPLPRSHRAPDQRASRPAPAEDPLPALIAQLSARLELPATSITPASSLLADLHLNSLQVVQAVDAVAAALGKQPPSAPLSLTDATVADVADVLRALPARHAPAGSAAAPGVRGWVRHFIPHWVPFQATAAPVVRWTIDAPAGHWLHELPDPGTGRVGLAVMLPEEAGRTEIVRLLRRVSTAQPDRLLIVHSGHPGAVGLARSVTAELDRCAVVVIQLPEVSTRVDPASLADAAGSRYLELRAGPGGVLERASIVATVPGAGAPSFLDAGDVCLVTGGIRGITAYSATALAERTGCTVVFAGRTPANDPEVVAALRNLRERVHADYVSCDVADPAAVRDLLALARRRGRIRSLLHGAGVNEPRLIGDVTAESFDRTLRPKVDGLRVLLDAAGADLRLVVGFGSIIGRQGLAGQAEYCLANDWLRVELERWAVTAPRCRTHLLEWTVWSGLGMGVRLEVLDRLRRNGVEPIGPRQGVAALAAVLADPDAPVTVMISSRFPEVPTLTVAGGTDLLPRFADRHRVRVPGVEAVVEADLSLGADPYLADHRIDGVPVLPAVLGMEALTQAAALAGARHRSWSLRGLEFRAPITLDSAGRRTIQLAALVEAGGVDVVLREDGDRFRADRFLARVEPAGPPPAARERAAPPEPLATPHPFYGNLLFHSGRLRRLTGYTTLSAFQVDAWIQTEDVPWFSEFHSPELQLGDPGAHDATLHALLACVPHRRALPVGVDRVTVWRRPGGPMRVLAREIAHTADEYTFTVDLLEPDGMVAARWQGLRLRAVSPVGWRTAIPRDLIGPWLSRRLIELGLADSVELVTTAGSRQAGSAAAIAARGTGSATWHDVAGALRVADRCASASYSDGHVMVALADGPIGVDWEVVPDTPEPCVPGVLGLDDLETADVLADKIGEQVALTAVRVWSAREALTKLGFEPAQRLRIDHVAEDGLAVAYAGSAQVVTGSVRIAEANQVAIAAVALAARG